MTWSLVKCSLMVLLPLLSLRAASLMARLLGRPVLPPGFPIPLGSQWGDASAVAVVRTPLEDQWGNAAALVAPVQTGSALVAAVQTGSALVAAVPGRSPKGSERTAAVLERTNWT